MLFTTATQFAALALVFVAGWLLGLASHPGGRKWRDRYAAEREAHAATRRGGDARVAEADARAAEWEREHNRLAKAAPVTGATVQPTSAPARPIAAQPVGAQPVDTRPVAASAARPAYAQGEKRGWFDWGTRTDRP